MAEFQKTYFLLVFLGMASVGLYLGIPTQRTSQEYRWNFANMSRTPNTVMLMPLVRDGGSGMISNVPHRFRLWPDAS
jgi:hypothetical protein